MNTKLGESGLTKLVNITEDIRKFAAVWELSSVWHVTKSWERLLMSARDEAAVKTWQRDLYSGAA